MTTPTDELRAIAEAASDAPRADDALRGALRDIVTVADNEGALFSSDRQCWEAMEQIARAALRAQDPALAERAAIGNVAQGASPVGDRAIVNGAASVSAVPASVPSAVWVVLRETGEYSDRMVTAIRYCLTEKEAERAVALTSVEAQRDAHLKPNYRSESAWGFQKPDGSWLPKSTSFFDPIVRESGADFAPLPDADAIEQQNKTWRDEYATSCIALGHVDPGGSWCGDGYYYEQVTVWPAQGMAAQSHAPERHPDIQRLQLGKPQ